MSAQEDRLAFRERVVERIRRDILDLAEARGRELAAAGRLDVFERAKLEGLRAFVPEIEDCNLCFLAELARRHGFEIEFTLADRVPEPSQDMEVAS